MKTFIFSLCIIMLFSCEKDISTNNEVIKKAESLKIFVKTGKFKPVSFYSDIPVDYDPTDSITAKETNLWRYVSTHITDDHIQFQSSDSLKITQNSLKIKEINDEHIIRKYTIEAKGNDIIFDFVDYNYNPLRYIFHEKSENFFILYIKKGDAKLFSRFEMIQ